jgi:hypothetical protein
LVQVTALCLHMRPTSVVCVRSAQTAPVAVSTTQTGPKRRALRHLAVCGFQSTAPQAEHSKIR